MAHYNTVFNQLLNMLPRHQFESSVSEFKNLLYILDATVIDLCLSLFPWAKFRKRKGGLKWSTY